jgi:hypothetical protein
MAKFRKGQRRPPNSGRRKGSKNLIPVEVKRAIHLALNEPPGAIAVLKRMRDSRTASDRSAFLHLVGKTVPREVTLEGNVDLNDGQVPVIITLPYNNRGPAPGETVEQFRARCERYDEQVRREAERDSDKKY